MNHSKLVHDIKKAVATEPFDVFHDIFHHYEVLKNCYEIINHEKLSPNLQILEIAALAHDYETHNKNNQHKKLKLLLKQHLLPNAVIDLIIQIINEHSISKEQTLLESKILFDADKLEFISTYRWEQALKAYQDGLFDITREIYYEHLTEALLDEVGNRLYFNFSKNLYPERRIAFINYVKTKHIYKDHNISIGYLK